MSGRANLQRLALYLVRWACRLRSVRALYISTTYRAPPSHLPSRPRCTTDAAGADRHCAPLPQTRATHALLPRTRHHAACAAHLQYPLSPGATVHARTRTLWTHRRGRHCIPLRIYLAACLRGNVSLYAALHAPSSLLRDVADKLAATPRRGTRAAVVSPPAYYAIPRAPYTCAYLPDRLAAVIRVTLQAGLPYLRCRLPLTCRASYRHHHCRLYHYNNHGWQERRVCACFTAARHFLRYRFPYYAAHLCAAVRNSGRSWRTRLRGASLRFSLHNTRDFAVVRGGR